MINLKLTPDKRRMKKDFTYPLVFRLTYNGQSRDIKTGYSIKESDWSSDDFMNDYNFDRPHESLGNISPINYKRKKAESEVFKVYRTNNKKCASTVDKEVRIFSASKEGNIYISANAVAYHSFAHKLLADFYVNHNKPAIPTKVFKDNDSAIVWLKTYRKT